MKVGDYVRARQGNIFKWDKYMTTTKEKCRDIDSPYTYVNQNDIIKSSPNIIDLIEVGDYVNGRHVDKYQGKLGIFCELPNGRWTFIEIANEHYLISSIVTREQFLQMEYKIGE